MLGFKMKYNWCLNHTGPKGRFVSVGFSGQLAESEGMRAGAGYHVALHKVSLHVEHFRMTDSDLETD